MFTTVSTEAKGVVPAEDVGVGAGKLPGLRRFESFRYPWDSPKISKNSRMIADGCYLDVMKMYI